LIEADDPIGSPGVDDSQLKGDDPEDISKNSFSEFANFVAGPSKRGAAGGNNGTTKDGTSCNSGNHI
jgi:hypothetical protein